jgi:lysozyme
MNLQEQILADLRRHEGCRLSVYKDTVGVWTIGYGHTKGVTKDTKPITQEQADEWLREEMIESIKALKEAYPWVVNLDKVRQTVLVNMCFNLGINRLSKFKNTLRFVEVGDYKNAALNMEKSLWAAQVGQRATELMKRMATGKIEPRHLVGE